MTYDVVRVSQVIANINWLNSEKAARRDVRASLQRYVFAVRQAATVRVEARPISRTRAEITAAMRL
jgi:hypothetical protein